MSHLSIFRNFWEPLKAYITVFNGVHKGLSAENLFSAFMKTGISPFDRSVISKERTMSAEAFYVNENCGTVVKGVSDNNSKHVDEYLNENRNAKSRSPMFVSKLDSILAKEMGTKTDKRSHIGKIISGQIRK